MAFQLPIAPAEQTDAVKAWFEPVVIPTYLPMAPEKNPMFLEKRIYQGSSGAVYPMPVVDRIGTEPIEHSWQAAHIENEFIRLMILPEIGGRIHVGLDKTNGYNFFYRQNVIKPALVGLAGPWISGGVEFNWPQHHRPATFMPVNARIENHDNGSRTIWCSDHDPLNRLKGMHGVCLHPGKSYIELKVRLHNRTPFMQTFLWWANVAVHVHERYQAFFPPDVRWVTDHAKRAVSAFPLCQDRYYGVNYGERARLGVPENEKSSRLVPPGTYAANDLSWYANVPVPTSYMAVGSAEDFFGGYDHKHQAGLIHIADHYISPGKKQWTWGNHEFGYAWDRNLTDEDGPYIELMAGVFTDNQPDFSYLAPGETRSFSQYWYPYREIGPVQKANSEVAIGVCVSRDAVRVGICATQRFQGAEVRIFGRTNEIARWTVDLSPVSPLIRTISQTGVDQSELVVTVKSQDGKELLRYAPHSGVKDEVATSASEPPLPSEILSNDELYVTGLHLDQYRHATRDPYAYWYEALCRDPGDSRCNNAVGLRYLRRGEFDRAERYFRNAIARLTKRNPNPRDGEPYYNLGLTLRYMRRDASAYDAFSKATWNYEWRSPAYYALAELDAKRGEWLIANQHLENCLRVNTDHSGARNLSVVILDKIGENEEARRLVRQTLDMDPMDSWARYLWDGSLPADNQMLLDMAFDYARAGLFLEAIKVLRNADLYAKLGSVPMVLYALGYFHQLLHDHDSAKTYYFRASTACRDYCFPKRLEELVILEAVLAANPEDDAAAYYLGNLLYDRRRHLGAVALWERAAKLNASFSVVWRNLGIAYFNIRQDCAAARSAFDNALQANPGDARVLYERDQLWKRLGEAPEKRLAELEKYADLLPLRDDLSIELATLYNETQQHEKALNMIMSRKFQPWEGGEGLVLGQYVRTHLALGRIALTQGRAREAQVHFESALISPENLGEARHLLANQSDIYYWLGIAAEMVDGELAAKNWWERAAGQRCDFRDMRVKSFSEMTYYNALALKRLNRTTDAENLLRSLLAYAEGLARQEAKIEYFATSLPDMLLFEDDLEKRQFITATFLQAQAWLGLEHWAKARVLLRRVLELHKNHSLARDLLAETERRTDSASERIGSEEGV